MCRGDRWVRLFPLRRGLLRGVMRPWLAPLRALRRAGDSGLAQRRAETRVHELFLVFLGLPDLDHEPSTALGRTCQVGMQTGGPVTVAGVLVDPEQRIHLLVLLGAKSLEFEDQQFRHQCSPLVDCTPPGGCGDHVRNRAGPYTMSIASPNSCQRYPRSRTSAYARSSRRSSSSAASMSRCVAGGSCSPVSSASTMRRRVRGVITSCVHPRIG